MASSFDVGQLVEGAARGFAEAIDEARADEVYEDRNLLALAFVIERVEQGCDGGWYHDETDTDYPVVWAVLPTGQVSWHVKPWLESWLDDNLPNETPVGGYDGHSRELKNDRLLNYVDGSETRLTPEDYTA